MLDCLILVPFEPATSVLLEPHLRSTYLSQVALPLEAATIELEDHVGVSLDYWKNEARPTFAGQELVFPKTRTLTAVVLASALEEAGVSWHAIDPGIRELDWWRQRLTALRRPAPRTVAISSTFVMNQPWLLALCRLVRRAFPQAKLLMGGAYYASNAKGFLALDADVFCVGEGEYRLPRIVRNIREGASLHDIPGLYLAEPDGSLRHTGHAAFIDLAARPRVDWSLAERIEPPIDLHHDLVEVGVETQRGCVFKCEFCSYRTLSAPNALAPEAAADAIMQTKAVGNAVVNILDATATFPHERWKAILRLLIARGGAPHALWAFARVSDIDEESAALMTAAGVRHLFVGQESGDQRMLDAMKKGTKVAHVRGAIEALARHGIVGTFAFIHGFPGETPQSIAATRELIMNLNRGLEARPPALVYLINPFSVPDFAAVAARDEFKDVPHHLDYRTHGMDSVRIFAEVLATIIAVSRVPTAPAHAHLFFKTVMPTNGSSVFARHDQMALFRWLKAVERGIAIFLERALEGTPIPNDELRQVREAILAAYPGPRVQPDRLRRQFGKPVLSRLQREWRAEPTRGAGLVTRVYLGTKLLRQTRDFGLGLRVLSTGEVAGLDVLRRRAGAHIDAHANELVTRARATSNKYLKSALPRGRGSATLRQG
jgi:anaerobic magnesium-protoporphyrin IX monomethyl ester cyclase